MYSDWSVFAGGLVLAAVFVWLGFLTFLIWKQGNFLKSLFPKSGERDIRKKFEEVLQQLIGFKESLNRVQERLAGTEQLELKHIQRIALTRYNPYDDTGGDQSFSLALLDKNGTGVVLTSLHARSGTRVFAKSVAEGKSAKYQFSKEEDAVIKKAMEN